MKLFKMYRTTPLAAFTAATGAINGKTTAEVIFVPRPDAFDETDEVEAIRKYGREGTFTGILLGLFSSDDGSYSRMFYADDVEVIYDEELLRKVADRPEG